MHRGRSSRPLSRPTKKSSKVGKEPWTKSSSSGPLRQPAAGSTVRDQIPLLTVPRTLGDAMVSVIASRPVDRWEQARPALEAIEAEQGGPRDGAKMAGLALAVREAGS